MRTLTLSSMNRVSQMNGSSASPSANIWLQASVQTFFSGVNWDGHRPVTGGSGLGLSKAVDEPPNLEMSVTRFFATFNWEGRAIAASRMVEAPKVSEQQEFTLDTFSDLF